MKLYSKHTSGEAYTLNGSDYVGFFHLSSGVAYTDRYHTPESVILNPKSTFISSSFTYELETDATYLNVSNLTPYYSNVFDILNKQGLDSALGTIDSNNLVCFKNLILGHPTIYQYEENNGFFYGIKNPNIDTATGKSGKQDVVPFSYDKKWSFMDDIICGTFVINSEEKFKYLCSTGTHNYVLSGDFNNKNAELAIIYEFDQHPYATYTPEFTHHIHNDFINNRILYVNDNFINVYDSSNYDDCGNLILIDKIILNKSRTEEYIWNRTRNKWKDLHVKFTTRFKTFNTNNPEFIKFGKNVRTSLNGSFLNIINKYSSDIYQSIDLSRWNVVEVLSLDIRETDDNIIILSRLNSQVYVIIIDPKNLDISKNAKISSIETFHEKYKIKFCNIDSNVFYITNTNEYQARFISNPTYPSGRLDTCDLGYGKQYKWNQVDQKFKSVPWTWMRRTKSNYFYNLMSSELIKNNRMYLLLHNVGRLYAMRQPLNNRFLNSLPLDIAKFYDGVTCSESSLGLYFNTSISNLVKDTLNLFNQSSGSFSIYERKVISRQLNDFIFQIDDLYINGNETINVITVQRIFLLITEIQTKLLPVSI